MSRKTTTIPKKQMATAPMTVAEFEHAFKLELNEKNKDMKVTEYYKKKGFSEFAKLLMA